MPKLLHLMLPGRLGFVCPDTDDAPGAEPPGSYLQVTYQAQVIKGAPQSPKEVLMELVPADLDTPAKAGNSLARLFTLLSSRLPDFMRDGKLILTLLHARLVLTPTTISLYAPETEDTWGECTADGLAKDPAGMIFDLVETIASHHSSEPKIWYGWEMTRLQLQPNAGEERALRDLISASMARHKGLVDRFRQHCPRVFYPAPDRPRVLERLAADTRLIPPGSSGLTPQMERAQDWYFKHRLSNSLIHTGYLGETSWARYKIAPYLRLSLTSLSTTAGSIDLPPVIKLNIPCVGFVSAKYPTSEACAQKLPPLPEQACAVTIQGSSNSGALSAILEWEILRESSQTDRDTKLEQQLRMAEWGWRKAQRKDPAHRMEYHRQYAYMTDCSLRLHNLATCSNPGEKT